MCPKMMCHPTSDEQKYVSPVKILQFDNTQLPLLSENEWGNYIAPLLHSSGKAV